jgi:amino acid adenylation domain-containing protein
MKQRSQPKSFSASTPVSAVATILECEEICHEFAVRSLECDGNLAIGDSHDTWTYGDLFAGARRLALLLSASGVRPGDLVVVEGVRCAGFVLSLVGTLIAGGRFLVLDQAKRSRKSVEMIERLQPKAWLSPGSDTSGAATLASLLSFANRRRFVELPAGKRSILDALAASTHGLSEAVFELPRRIGGRGPAYLIWTSGTTSAPKLVSTYHDSVVNFLRWYRRHFDLGEADRFSLLSGLSHDPVLRDVFAPLSVGACVCVPTEAQRTDPGALFRWIAESAITVMHLTPVMIELLSQSNQGSTVDSVRLLAFGGDRLTERHVDLARGLFPCADLVNFYGTTETPQVMAYHCVPRAATAGSWNQAVPIGKGIDGAELLVLDERQQRCGAGEQGEVYVRSRFLAEGYVDLPEANAERFVANPLTGDPADRAFRTGDLGVYLADGSVRLSGRRDRQVKINGNRVDLADVEAEIARFESVAQAAVVYDAASAQLVAYVVEAAGRFLSESALRRHLAEAGPLQIVPAKIIVVDALPVTLNGKIDYLRLDRVRPSERPPTARRDRSSTALRSAEALREVWQEALDRSDIDLSTNFYDVGGDSIVAARIAYRIQETLGMPVRVADLFIYPTIGALAVYLSEDRELAAHDRADDVGVRMAGRERAISRARMLRGRADG